VKTLAGLVAFVLLTGPSPSYFHYLRPVEVSSAGQNYITVDETVWKHSRSDLGDLRLYAAESEVPYCLVVERGNSQRERIPVPVLQQSAMGGKTLFLIDMSALAEYDHVDLNLATRDFVAHAWVEGSDDVHARSWAALGDSILYDLSKENLGRNSMLRLPRATYKYLRVIIDGPVKPADVLGATSEMGENLPALWRDVGGAPRLAQNAKDKETVLAFDLAENVPAERVVFAVDADQPNFQRKVEIQDEKGGWIGSGEINRIHMVRGGQKIDSEDQEVIFPSSVQKTIRVVIHNGDDPPLKLTGARLQQVERRVYFDTAGPGQTTLYFGDDKLEPPVYDYAKLFQRDKAAAQASLGPEAPNPAYTGRPDERAWSERHPVVLWVAIIAAVIVLGGLALRSFRAATGGSAGD